MVDVASKRCGHRGCNKQPTYGMEGSKTAEFCADHAKHGIVNRRSGRALAGQTSSINPVLREERERTDRAPSTAAGEGVLSEQASHQSFCGEGGRGRENVCLFGYRGSCEAYEPPADTRSDAGYKQRRTILSFLHLALACERHARGRGLAVSVGVHEGQRRNNEVVHMPTPTASSSTAPTHDDYGRPAPRIECAATRAGTKELV